MRQNPADMDCSKWIKQEPFSPTKRTFSEAFSPTPDQTDVHERSGDEVEQAPANGQLLPFIKKELKYTILNRRFAKGQDEIVLKDPPKPKVKQDLTAAEKERKSRRREQNRRAATKCRNKKKGQEDKLMTTFFIEQEKNETLTKQIDDLRSERARLKKFMEEHLNSSECTMSQRANSYTPPLSAHIPPGCHDQTAGSVTSPSLYGGDIFTFDKLCPVAPAPCPSYMDYTSGQTGGLPLPPCDTLPSLDGPIHVPITPPGDDIPHHGEFQWAESFSNITALLSRDFPEEIPVLNSDDLNNLAPPCI